MDIEPTLQTDAEGNIITFPVTGWITGVIAEVGIILAIQHVETLAALESGENRMTQYALSPKIALELSAKLSALAERILNAPCTGTPPN